MTVIDNVASCKTKRVKGNNQNWFNGEVLEKLRSRDKLFKVFKKTRHHIGKKIYKKAKYDAQKLIAPKSKHSLMKNSQKVLANQKNYRIA